jgi:hypothetical protein
VHAVSAAETEIEAQNKRAVQAACDATWIITGNSFLDAVIKPFNARLTKPLVPTMRGLDTDGDTVDNPAQVESWPCPG